MPSHVERTTLPSSERTLFNYTEYKARDAAIHDASEPTADGSYLFDHFVELLVLVFPQLLVVLHGADVQLMLGLRLRRLEWAGEDRNFNIPKLL